MVGLVLIILGTLSVIRRAQHYSMLTMFGTISIIHTLRYMFSELFAKKSVSCDSVKHSKYYTRKRWDLVCSADSAFLVDYSSPL